MARFHIVRIAINQHRAMYDELAGTLAAGLAELGHDCTQAINEVAGGAVNLLLGSTIFAADLLRLPSRLKDVPFILYQLEQLDDVQGLLPAHPVYRELLSLAAARWDYAPSSAAFLARRGLTVSLVPPAYHPILESFRPVAFPEFDVLLVGSPHPRRSHVLDGLAASGLKVCMAHGAYGPQRDAMIAKARIILNIHAWDGITPLETVRLSHLLANRCFVISEAGDHDPYQGDVVYAGYQDLEAACHHWLAKPTADRLAMAERGHRALRRTPIADSLAPAISALGDLGRLAAPRSASLLLPAFAPGLTEQEVIDLLGRENVGPWEDGMIRLMVLGGSSSYEECRAVMTQYSGQMVDCGVLALWGVGREPGVTRLHSELVASPRAPRELYVLGSLRLFSSAEYSADGVPSAARSRAMRMSSFLIE